MTVDEALTIYARHEGFTHFTDFEAAGAVLADEVRRLRKERYQLFTNGYVWGYDSACGTPPTRAMYDAAWMKYPWKADVHE